MLYDRPIYRDAKGNSRQTVCFFVLLSYAVVAIVLVLMKVGHSLKTARHLHVSLLLPQIISFIVLINTKFVESELLFSCFVWAAKNVYRRCAIRQRDAALGFRHH